MSPAQAREVWEGWIAGVDATPAQVAELEADALRILGALTEEQCDAARVVLGPSAVLVALVRRVAELEARLLADPPAVDLVQR